MRTFTTLAAIFAFALHLLLGCCWHHAHGASEVAGHHHHASGQHVHLPKWLSFGERACCHSHDHEHGHSHGHEHVPASESTPTPHAPCSDTDCVFQLCSPQQIDFADELASPIAMVDLQLQAGASFDCAHKLVERDKVFAHLRRHLALSRLLN